MTKEEFGELVAAAARDVGFQVISVTVEDGDLYGQVCDLRVERGRAGPGQFKLLSRRLSSAARAANQDEPRLGWYKDGDAALIQVDLVEAAAWPRRRG